MWPKTNKQKNSPMVWSLGIKRGKIFSKNTLGDLPGGAVVKNPAANAGDTGSSPGPGRSHMPWSN